MDANHSNRRVTEDNWRSIHVDYIQFAFQSYLLSKTNVSDPFSRVFL